MKQLLAITLLTFLLNIGMIQNSYAQYAEIGVGGGMGFYLGDIVAPISEITQYHPAAGMFIRGTVLNGFLSGRVGIMRGSISGDDKYSRDYFHIIRNLNFTSNISEIYIVGELNLFSFNPCKKRNFSPYIVGGIAAFHFDPTTSYFGETVHLQPLGTEGQGMPGYSAKYKLNSVSIPMGGGIKLAINNRLTISGELVMRKTFTDYLDDVSTSYPDRSVLAANNGKAAADLSYRGTIYYNDSQLQGLKRGQKNLKDWYNFLQVNFAYIFASRCHASEYRGRMYIGRLGCYNF
jgi:hypothetical protein